MGLPWELRSSLDQHERETLLELHRLFVEAYPYLSTRDGAFGCCRWASLQFALMASQKGIFLNITRWQVWPANPHNEHWAIDLGQDRIFDPTGAQVDGLPSSWVCVSDYPESHTNRETVPAFVLLPAYHQHCSRHPGRQGPSAMSEEVMQWLDRLFDENLMQQMPA